MGWSRDLGFVSSDEISGMAKAATAHGVQSGDFRPEDQDCLRIAVEVAKVAVANFGGHAHVHVGGHDRILGGMNEPEVVPEQVGKRQRSVTVTVTVIEDAPAKA